jgi:hypothetical protein
VEGRNGGKGGGSIVLLVLQRRAFALGVAIVASIVASAVAARDLPPIKTVGVVSDVGDKIRLQHIGFMVFSNKLTPVDVPEWGMDAHITGVIESALRERFAIAAVDFPRGEIAPDLGGFALFGGPSPKDNMRAKAKPAGAEPIDAYIVVWPNRRNVYPTNQQVEGIGLLTQGKRARLYISLIVTLLDGQTFKEIDVCAAKVRPTSFGDPGASYMTDANDLYAESFDELTAEQKQKLEQGLKAMLTDGTNFCLRDLKLVN